MKSLRSIEAERTGSATRTSSVVSSSNSSSVVSHISVSPISVNAISVNPGSGKRFSRDEMNLAEFPLAILSTRHDASVKTLEFSDTLFGKNGERTERKWIITGADKFGLPTASDDEVLLGLLRLSAGQEFRDRKVTFTRYELLRILKWSTEGRSYGRLQRALDRLSGVRIKTSNGFFDNSTKSHQTRNFGIIDAYELNDSRAERDVPRSGSASGVGASGVGAGKEPAQKPSFFIWSEAMFNSFQSGFIKKLDLDFLLGLKSAVSKRLYRFLDKHFWYRSKIQYNLFTLAHEKIGISRNYSYASQLKQQLEPAIDELVANGFLLGCEYVGKGSDTEIVLVAGSGQHKGNLTNRADQVAGDAGAFSAASRGVRPSGGTGVGFARPDIGPKPQASTALLSTSAAVSSASARAVRDGDEFLSTPRDLESENRASPSSFSEVPQPEQITLALEARGLAKPQALRLVGALTDRQRIRAQAVISYFDELIRSDSTRVSRNPAGFLYRAIERVDSFVLPGEKRDGGSIRSASAIAPRISVGKSLSIQGARTGQDALAKTLASQVARERDQRAHQKEHRRELFDQVEPDLLARIRKEVTESLSKLRGLISEPRFQDTIEHAVEERVTKLLAI